MQQDEDKLAGEESAKGPEATPAPQPAPKRAPRPGEEGFEFVRVRLPDGRNKEFFGIADQLMGASRIKVNCEDGKSRLGRIPGKMKKRMWIRTGDLLIVKPWDFQDDKCDILYRYTRTQSVNLSKRRKIPASVDIFQEG